MTNRVLIEQVQISGNRIDYRYTVGGEWAEAFNLQEPFFIEYECDISSVPESVAAIPLLANLLPMAWVYDAEIVAPACDKDFWDSVEAFKKGYADMYPMIELKGKLTVSEVQDNRLPDQRGAVALFSGGVDAFNTLICHADEKPVLLSVWGIDIEHDNTAGWEVVETHIRQAARDFGTDLIVIKSCLRRFLDKRVLGRKVAPSGDLWWHGFQHGVGTISQAAPVVYALKKSTVYFASTYTAADVGRVTCASDPTIDNFVRFCGARTVHDGYEYNRQMKLQNIIRYCEKNDRRITVRVCWSSKSGFNCCLCEKCWRTMLGIYAEKRDPVDYGFDLAGDKLKAVSKKMHYGNIDKFSAIRYRMIQDRMRENCRAKDLPKPIRWFYFADVTKLDKDTLPKKLRRTARRLLRGVRGRSKPG